MHKKLKRSLILITGILFIVLGLIGLVLPLVPQVLFFAIGLILLSLISPRVRDFLDTHTTRFPRIHKVIREVEEWVVRIVGEH